MTPDMIMEIIAMVCITAFAITLAIKKHFVVATVVELILFLAIFYHDILAEMLRQLIS